MDKPVLTMTYRDLLMDVGKELVRFGIQEYMRQPVPTPIPQGPYRAQPIPDVRYQVPNGCPWCSAAKNFNNAEMYLRRWLNIDERYKGDDPKYISALHDAYIRMTRDLLDETRAMIAVMPALSRLSPQLDTVQNMLLSVSPSIPHIVELLVGMMQNALAGGEERHPTPMPTNERVLINGRVNGQPNA